MQSPIQPPHTRTPAPPRARFIDITTEFCGSLLNATYLESHRSSDPRARINTDQEFVIENGLGKVALVEANDCGFILRYQEHWVGWVCIGDTTYALGELRAKGLANPGHGADSSMEFPIPAKCTIVVKFELLEFWIRPTPAVQKLPMRKSRHKEESIYRYLFGATVLVLALVFAAGNLAERPKTLHSERFDPSPGLVQSLVVADSKSATEAETLQPAYPNVARARPRFPKNHEAPYFGGDSATSDDDFAASDAESMDQAARRARGAGIVGLGTRKAAEAVAAATDFQFSSEEVERLDGLLPSEVDEKTGAWGHGIRKIGPGSGDGKDWGAVKVRNYRLATGAQRGDDAVAEALTRPHEATAPPPSKALASILDSGIKYDVIRGQLGLRKRRIRMCFEKELSIDEDWPSLIHVGLEISQDGEVIAAKMEEYEGHDARACVEKTLQSIQFPEPSDGKVVRVEHFPVRV